MQPWAVRCLDGAGPQFQGMHERHGDRHGRSGCVRADAPEVLGQFGGTTLAPEVVEADGRLGSGHVRVSVEVAQQPVAQGIRQRPQLLLGVLDDGAQCRVTGDHLCPADASERDRNRGLGGEPADGAGQVDVGAEIFMTPVALDIDADRPAVLPREFGERQGESDDQNVVDPDVERRGDGAQQRRGGRGVQFGRQVPRGGKGVYCGLYGRQHGGRLRDPLPCRGVRGDVRGLGMLGEQFRPPPERRAPGRQRHGLSGPVLHPGDI